MKVEICGSLALKGELSTLIKIFLYLDKPRYLNMTSVLTLPSHMSGFLHELGNHSGVYRYGYMYR